MATIEAIIFYLILADALIVNVIAWGGMRTEFNKKFGLVSRFFPITRGWSTYYLVLVFWIGYGLLRLGTI